MEFKNKIALVVCCSTVITMWMVLLYFYQTLPADIPLQFDMSGSVTKRGSKALIFILPALASYLCFRFLKIKKIGLSISLQLLVSMLYYIVIYLTIKNI